MGRLDGKVVLITGGARGQGAAECQLFAAEGARVVITDVLDVDGEATAARYGAVFLHHDVTSEDQWAAVVARTLDLYGNLTGLVNNAAIWASDGLRTTGPALFQRIVAVNQVGPYLGMRAAAPAMEASGGGSIVNIASVAALIGQASSFAYSASKWALRGMSRSAAMELAGSNIRVNCVLPGPIDTPMVGDAPSRPPRIPLRRWGQPIELARLVLYLLSDESAFCTGSEFAIDGGMAAG